MSGALLPRIERFLNRPWNEKRSVVQNRLKALWGGVDSKVRVIRRLNPGFLWIPWGDVIREEVLGGDFERAERSFVERFLQPGMTVLDIGAYYGLYTLTASVKVGREGRVIAFEPSPYQMKRLRWHLLLNCSKNVRAECIALGRVECKETLFSVPGPAAGFSSLRRPDVREGVEPIPVQIITVDSYLRRHSIGTVDLIKIDVEGGELDVFKGAEDLLQKKLRPVILCELQDMRTEAWGHKAKDTAAFIESFGFRWFRPISGGSLARWNGSTARQERNFVAVPPERMIQVEEMIRDGSCGAD